MTPEQSGLVRTITAELSGDPAVEAAWLTGSLGRGGGDAFSDVDILALVAEDRVAEVSARYAAQVGRIAEPVLVNALYGGRIINVVTADWRRFDLSFATPAELPRYDAAQLTSLFNRSGAAPPAQPPASYAPAASAVSGAINEFLRVLGLGIVVIGRGEWLVAQAGQALLRRMTIDLMLDANGVGPAARGGALRLNALLTAEQRAALEALPPLAAGRENAVAATAAIANLFLPRAKALAAQTGAPWPADFEAATKRYLAKGLGIVLP